MNFDLNLHKLNPGSCPARVIYGRVGELHCWGIIAASKPSCDLVPGDRIHMTIVIMDDTAEHQLHHGFTRNADTFGEEALDDAREASPFLFGQVLGSHDWTQAYLLQVPFGETFRIVSGDCSSVEEAENLVREFGAMPLAELAARTMSTEPSMLN